MRETIQEVENEIQQMIGIAMGCAKDPREMFLCL